MLCLGILHLFVNSLPELVVFEVNISENIGGAAKLRKNAPTRDQTAASLSYINSCPGSDLCTTPTLVQVQILSHVNTFQECGTFMSGLAELCEQPAVPTVPLQNDFLVRIIYYCARIRSQLPESPIARDAMRSNILFKQGAT